jgi:hypothetical protein
MMYLSVCVCVSVSVYGVVQIMASVDNPDERAAVLPILSELARTYPQALYFPFKIGTEKISAAAADDLEEVRQLMVHPMVCIFSRSL